LAIEGPYIRHNQPYRSRWSLSVYTAICFKIGFEDLPRRSKRKGTDRISGYHEGIKNTGLSHSCSLLLGVPVIPIPVYAYQVAYCSCRLSGQLHHSLLNPYPDVLSALTALPVELGATPVTPTTKGTKYKDYSGLAIIQPLENSGLACR
jgi:hypothetical protein